MGRQSGGRGPVSSAPPSPAPPAGALSHVRVLDLSRVLAGPWAGQTLGDMGADVIKIEHPARGDDTRGWGPPFITTADASAGDASYYTAANRNKRSVGIDFSSEAGAALVRRLAEKADVIIENYKLGGLKKYGLDYESVRETNPGVIYCSITGFGQDGPYAARAGYDFIIQGMSGLMSITGQPDGTPGGEPMKVGVAVCDVFGGLYATTAILSALLHRERTGEGQHIDCALLETQIAALANQAASYLTAGVVAERMGNKHPTVVPYRVFAVSDGHLIVAVGNDSQFAKLCDAIGARDLKADPRYTTNAQRIRNRDTLEPALEAIFSRWTRDDLIAALEKVQVPCGPINTIGEIFNDPHVAARELVEKQTRPDGTQIAMVRYPVKLSATPAAVRIAPPSLGADTHDVLAAELGLSEDEIAALQKKGVISR
ncbi:MAG: CoA transferase [Alphaproteobacteria bacterium]|nr:MAG: CoA transferase [Alphaproteobacteria bacterium]